MIKLREKRVNLICFYTVATHLGGAERSLLDLVSGLKEKSNGRYVPWIILPQEEGPLVEEIKKKGLDFSVVPMPTSIATLSRSSPITALTNPFYLTLETLNYIRVLYETIKARSPNIVHTNGIKCHIFGRLVGLCLNLPVLWHIRDIIKTPKRLNLTWILMRTLHCLGSTHIVANSRATQASFGSTHLKCTVVYNGLEKKEWIKSTKARDEWRSRFGVSSNEPLIGIVGVLTRWKGQIEFLRMAKKLLDSGIKARFAVVGGEIYTTLGEQGYLTELKNETETLGIKPNVIFTGFLKDASSAIQAMDILVHASIRPEPFGRVIIEAMACETPLVASAAGGVLEIVEHNKTGLLYEPSDIDEMASHVKKILNSPTLAEELRKGGKEQFLSHFTLDKHIENMIAIYNQITSKDQGLS